MSVITKIKSLLNGLGKGGDTVENIADLSKIETAQSPTMKARTDEWWNVFCGKIPREKMHKHFAPLLIAYTSTAYLAQLVTGEIKFELPDEGLNFFVQKNLIPNLDRITQLTLVGGYTVIKPYITRSGEIFFDVGMSRDFKPITLDENGHITEGIFRELIRYKGKIYERREHHRFDGEYHFVRNTAWLYGTRQQVELSEIPRWAMLLPEKMSAKVFADETVINGKKGIPDDYFVTFMGDGTSTVEQQIMTYAPQIREEAHKAAINTELRLYEVQIGVSSGTFTFDSQKGLVTATQVLSEDKTTYNTVAQLQRQLRPVLEALSKITVTLARFYGIECEDGDPAIEFGDSVFEDTGTEFNRRFQLVQAGLLKPEEFNAWYFGVPLEKAREMLPVQTTLFDG